MLLRDNVIHASFGPARGDLTTAHESFISGETSGVAAAVAAKRRAQIQSVVNFTAVILFGALGALAGVTLVILMLVALVIPTTTSLVMASAAIASLGLGAALWLKRRALSRVASNEIPSEQLLAATA